MAEPRGGSFNIHNSTFRLSPLPAPPSRNRQPMLMERDYALAFGGTAQEPLPLQSLLPPAPRPLQAFLPAQPCLASFDAQPPLPLQEFLPAQPLSPDLQLPWLLQELRPLHACLSAGAALSVPSSGAAETPPSGERLTVVARNRGPT